MMGRRSQDAEFCSERSESQRHRKDSEDLEPEMKENVDIGMKGEMGQPGEVAVDEVSPVVGMEESHEEGARCQASVKSETNR